MPAAEYPQSQKDKITSYLLVMDEVRARLEVLNSVVSNPTMHFGLVIEICYLQFRHIAELVAIACLLAYGDFEAYKSFDKEYSPAEVFKHLDRIWPHFFPQPVTRSIQDGVHHIEANSKPNAMSRKEMETLWSKSGDKLHRLSISKFFKQQPSVLEHALDQVKSITAKIIDLLNEHTITLPSPKRMLVVALYQPDCRVRAQSIIYGENNTMQIEEFILK